MKKKIYIILLIIFFVIATIATYSLMKKNESKKIIINNGKENIKINDIYNNSIEELPQGGIKFKNNEYYSIDYYPQDNGFMITIINSDIQTAREMAEKNFIETLGINKDSACKLKVSLSVPYSINAVASGHNYGLSFCPGSAAFPK